jgi:hypothetical protein
MTVPDNKFAVWHVAPLATNANYSQGLVLSFSQRPAKETLISSREFHHGFIAPQPVDKPWVDF